MPARGGRRWGPGGSGGEAGINLQNAPNVGTSDGTPAQSYAMGLPQSRMRPRPIAAYVPGSDQGGVPGTTIGYQSGNPGMATWDTRQVARSPMWGGFGPAGWTDSGNAKLPGDELGDPQGKIAPRMPFQEDDKLGGWSVANDKLVTRDRHVFLKVGHENSGRGSGQTDPPMDGPPRPALASINRSITWQQGTVYADPSQAPINSSNGNPDDLSRQYGKTPTGQWIGEQGSGWSSVYGGVPGLYQPYGSYGGVCAGPVQGVQSPVAEGSPGDGPRKVWSGPAHGLHTPTLPDYASTIGYYMALPAQRAPRMDRPDNSTAAGQSYSQTVQPQGQTGTIAANPKGNVWNQVRFAPGGGWRGL